MDQQNVLNNRKNLREQLKAKFFVNQTPPVTNNSIVSTEGEQQQKKKTIKTRSFEQSYTLLDDEILGEGAHAVVKQCESIQNGKRYAVKIQRSGDPEVMNQNNKAYRLQKMVNHLNVVKVKELFMDEKKERIYFVMELCPYPSLKQILRKQHIISENNARILIKSILNSLDAIHSKGICHRDLKPDNMTDMFTKTGTLQYMAPEMFTLANYDESVDMWAVGIITYEILCGSLPFAHEYIMETQEQIMGCLYEFNTLVPEAWLYQKQQTVIGLVDSNNLETITEAVDKKYEETPLSKGSTIKEELKLNLDQFKNIKLVNVWDSISQSAIDFIKRLIRPNKRLNIKAALLHPWFTNTSKLKKKNKLTKDDSIHVSLSYSHLNHKLLQSMPLNNNFINFSMTQKKINNLQSIFFYNFLPFTRPNNITSSIASQELITKSKLMSKDDIHYIKKEQNNDCLFKFNRMDNSEWNKSFKSSYILSQNSSIAKSDKDTQNSQVITSQSTLSQMTLDNTKPQIVNNFLLSKNDFKKFNSDMNSSEEYKQQN